MLLQHFPSDEFMVLFAQSHGFTCVIDLAYGFARYHWQQSSKQIHSKYSVTFLDKQNTAVMRCLLFSWNPNYLFSWQEEYRHWPVYTKLWMSILYKSWWQSVIILGDVAQWAWCCASVQVQKQWSQQPGIEISESMCQNKSFLPKIVTFRYLSKPWKSKHTTTAK
jgi:hypothetical protein